MVFFLQVNSFFLLIMVKHSLLSRILHSTRFSLVNVTTFLVCVMNAVKGERVTNTPCFKEFKQT